jgi:hypothetical protein
LKNQGYAKASRQKQIKLDAQSRKLVYWLHYRVLGLCQRNAGTVLKIIPVKLVPQGGRPPVESEEEIQKSNILEHINKRGKHTLHSDGAHAWPAALRKVGRRGVVSKRCNHKMKQYCHPISDVPASRSKLTGTMCMDGRWYSLQQFKPRTLKTRLKHAVNPTLNAFMYQWLYRHNNLHSGKTNIIKALGLACARYSQQKARTS